MPLFSKESSHLPPPVVSNVLLGFFSDKDVHSLARTGKEGRSYTAETLVMLKGKNILKNSTDYLLFKDTRLDSKIGYQMLGEGLLTIADAHRIGRSKLDVLLCENGLTVLRKKYFTIDAIYGLKNHFSLQNELSAESMKKREVNFRFA